MATVVQFIVSITAGTAIGFAVTIAVVTIFGSVIDYSGPSPMKDPTFALLFFGFCIICGAVAGLYSYRAISNRLVHAWTQDGRQPNDRSPDFH